MGRKANNITRLKVRRGEAAGGKRRLSERERAKEIVRSWLTFLMDANALASTKEWPFEVIETAVNDFLAKPSYREYYLAGLSQPSTGRFKPLSKTSLGWALGRYADRHYGPGGSRIYTLSANYLALGSQPSTQRFAQAA